MDYRPITPEEFDAFFKVLSHAFSWDPKPEELELEKNLLEFDRTIAAFDGGRIVGTGANYSFTMTVPGGSLPAGGVTMIGVLPSHRRRGILTSMMAELLEDSRKRGEPVSILWASESSIYGRFGFGMCDQSASRTVERAHATFRPEVTASGTVRVVDKTEAAELMPAIYEQVVSKYPGMIERTAPKWEVTLADLETWRQGLTSNRFAIYEENGEPRGYARYRVKDDWKEGHAQFVLHAGEVIGVDAAAERGLWRFLFSLDLIKEIHARHRPLRDGLAYYLTDPRRMTFSVEEGIWIRILDVPVALSTRRYQVEGSLTIEVIAPDDVAGVYRLDGGPVGATCVKTSGEADLRLDVTTLGMAYLGCHDFSSLAAAGLVEGSTDVLRKADVMFGWYEPTWCVVGF